MGGGRGGGSGGEGSANGRAASGWKRCKHCGQKGHTVGECPSITECSHCGSPAHTAKRCTFGADASERFLPCASVQPHLPCFWRRFIVPLRRADALAFDPAAPCQGRADVGLRCASAALFRSQGLRRNTQVCLSFEASGHTLEISGALVRDLRPDEACVAQRVRAGLDTLQEGCEPPDPAEDPVAWSASRLRGFEARARTTLKALRAAAKWRAPPARPEEEAPTRVVVLLLAEDGIPVAKACSELRVGPPLAGVVAVIGDDRGFAGEDCAALSAAAERAGADVVRVSLGGTTLLASHALVILQHYLDDRLHRCDCARARDYGHGRRPGGNPAPGGAEGPAKRRRGAD